MEKLSQTYAKEPNFVARKIAGEMVLVPIKQKADDLDCIFTLNGTGAYIWEIIDGSMTTVQIRDALVDKYEVTPEQAKVDLVEFLDQLEEIGAVSLVTVKSTMYPVNES
jgi:hypothetical protein